MDPYASYTYPSNFEPRRNDRPQSAFGSSQAVNHQPSSQQQLPPFREILGTHLQSSTVDSGCGDSLPNNEYQDTTRKTFQPPSIPTRSEPQSPAHSQMGNSVEAFETMSARSIDSVYPATYSERRNSSWAPPSQYPELVSPYNTEQRLSYQSQPAFSPSRENASLPPIRDIDRMGTYDSPYPPPTNAYPPFGPPAPTQNAHDNYALGADRPAYFDPSSRQGYAYPPPSRPTPQADYARYAPSPYGYRAGAPYPSPYGPGDYLPSPTGSHQPTSPTVAMDADNRNRKRRGNLPRQITDIFRAWFYEHLDHPYPTEEDKQIFAERTGLTMAQISNWFINARRRQLPALRTARDRQAQSVTAEYDQEHLRR